MAATESTSQIPVFPVPNSTILDPSSPTTTAHLASLSHHIQDLSPALAALHLARIRLLFHYGNISDSPFSPETGSLSRGPQVDLGMRDWWCSQCGGLREGLGGAEWAPRGKRKGDGVKAGGVKEVKHGGVPLERSWTLLSPIEHPTLTHAIQGRSSNAPAQAARSISLVPSASTQRKPPVCTVCGEPFKRPTRATAFSSSKYPIARTTRLRSGSRIPKAMLQSQTDAQSGIPTSLGESFGSTETEVVPVTSTINPTPSDKTSNGHPTPIHQSQASVVLSTPTEYAMITDPPQPQVKLGAREPSPLQNPQLRYIPKAPPQPPTYPQPSASPQNKRSVDGDAGKPKKRKKVSGLAKLLAQHKERDDVGTKGSWGFG